MTTFAARSSNAATVRLSEKVGRSNVIRAARDLGITTPIPDKPSLALGTGGVSLLELTSAYAAIASGRYPVIARGLPRPDAPEGLASRSYGLPQENDLSWALRLLLRKAGRFVPAVFRFVQESSGGTLKMLIPFAILLVFIEYFFPGILGEAKAAAWSVAPRAECDCLLRVAS